MTTTFDQLAAKVRPLLADPKPQLLTLSQLLTSKVQREQPVPWYVPNHYTEAEVTGIGELWNEVAQAVIPLLHDPDTTCRRQAIHVLSLAPSQHAHEAAIAALEDADWSVQTSALELLGDQQVHRAKAHMVPFLAHPSEDLRLHAIMSLGKLGSVELLERFNELFLNDPETAVQGWAAIVMAVLAPSHVQDRLFERICQPELNIFLLDGLINAIHMLGSRAFAPLFALLSRNEDVLWDRAAQVWIRFPGSEADEYLSAAALSATTPVQQRIAAIEQAREAK